MEDKDVYNDVRVILEDLEGRILLLKKRGKFADGMWCLPGGGVEYGQTIEDACRDELKQEVDLDISCLKYLFYHNDLPNQRFHRHYITFYFTAEFTGRIEHNDESYTTRWVYPKEIENYKIAFDNDSAIMKYLDNQ